MARSKRGDSARISRYGLKFTTSLIGLGVAASVGRELAAFFETYSTMLSARAMQVLEVVEFLPLLLAWGLLIRYSAQWLMHLPKLSSDAIVQYEKSTVRGVFSLSILLGGIIWWSKRVLTGDLFGHAIFTWPSLITILGLSYGSWYYSKMGAYRKAVFDGHSPSSSTNGRLPTPIKILTGIKGGEVTIEKIGLDRGLPTVLFRIEYGEGDDIILNLGLERLFPTALFKQDE